MKNLFYKRTASPLNNEQGVAALITIIMAIIILGSVAFNFVAETRQKQSGAILTYTSTNSLMIAEAGLRFTQKCLLEVDATWGCPTSLQNVGDWTTITSTENFNKDFGGDGNFAISFPVHANNDGDNIFVTATGTFRGGQRSFSRFISRICVLGENAITSCLGTTTKNNSLIDPPLPDPPITGECPEDPPGIVGPFPDAPVECDSCPSVSCPHFDTGDHLLAGNWLDPSFTRFCDFKIKNGEVVKTHVGDHNNLVVKKDLEIKDNSTIRLNDDAVDPLDATKDTIITVYDDASLLNNGEIKVKGTLTLNVSDKFEMKNSSRINNTQGEAANASVWVENDASIKNSSLLVGALASDGTISLKNNSEVQGALFGYSVELKNNATVIFTDNEDAGSSTTGYSQCTSGDIGPNWSE
jgi:hypothetical protein